MPGGEVLGVDVEWGRAGWKHRESLMTVKFHIIGSLNFHIYYFESGPVSSNISYDPPNCDRNSKNR